MTKVQGKKKNACPVNIPGGCAHTAGCVSYLWHFRIISSQPISLRLLKLYYQEFAPFCNCWQGCEVRTAVRIGCEVFTLTLHNFKRGIHCKTSKGIRWLQPNENLLLHRAKHSTMLESIPEAGMWSTWSELLNYLLPICFRKISI